MSDLLVIATVVGGGGNGIEIAYAADAQDWCAANIPQSSQAAPALGVLNGNLWTAFRGNTHTTIYAASLTDLRTNNPTGQDSNFAPAIAAFNGKLWIAYIGTSSGHVEVISSSDGINWPASDKVDTGLASTQPPALAAFGGVLWLAYLDGSGSVMVTSSAKWGIAHATGQNSKLGPALAAYDGSLWVGYIGEDAAHVETVSSPDGSTWLASTKTDTQQTSNLPPALCVFDGKLYAAHVDGSGKVQLVSLIKPPSWSTPSYTGRTSKLSPALASIAAAAFGGTLGGSSQYIFASPYKRGEPAVGLQNLVVALKVKEAITLSPFSGIPPANVPQSISIQINGFSQKGDTTICWQQYGFQMNPGNNQLTVYAENWPQSLNTNSNAPNVFNLNSPGYISLPDDLTIPAGWTVTVTFQQENDGTITGFDCAVTESSGTQVGSTLSQPLLKQPLAAGGTIGSNDLAKMVAFQVVIVGWANGVNAMLTGGSGQIVCSSSTVMTISDQWPPDSDGDNGTAENTNAIYSLVPAQQAEVISQNFAVNTAPLEAGPEQPGLMMLVVDSDGDILAGVSTDGAHWSHSHAMTPGFVKTGHSSQATPGLVAVGGQGDGGNMGTFCMAMLGKTDNGLYWRGSSDGVNWDQDGNIGLQGKFPPSLMMYYNAKNTGTGPWLGFVADNSTNHLMVASAPDWGANWSGATAIGQTSQFGPALSGMIDYLVMVFVSNDSSNGLLACRTQPNSQGQWVWGGANDTGLTAAGAPSLAGLDNNLWMAWLANDASGDIWVVSSADGVNWQSATRTGHQSRTAPFMVNASGMLFIAFVGLHDSEARITSSIDGVNWSQSVSTGVRTAFTPAITGFNFELNFSLG